MSGKDKRPWELTSLGDPPDDGPTKKRPFGKKCPACKFANVMRAKRCAACSELFPEKAPGRQKARKQRRAPVFEPQVDDDGTYIIEFIASKKIDAAGVDANAAGMFARLYGARTKLGSRIKVDWLSAEQALRLGKRSRAAFSRFAQKAYNGDDDDADADVVERILDCRDAPRWRPRFLEDAPDAADVDASGKSLPDFAYFGPLDQPRGRDWGVEGDPRIGEWFTDLYSDDGGASPRGAASERGRARATGIRTAPRR